MIDGALHEYKEKPGACSDCGNSPVNHFEHYISNTLAVWTAEVAYRDAGVFARLYRLADWIFDHVEQLLLRVLALMPFASLSNKVEGAATYRSQVVWEEAVRRGIEMRQVLVFGKATEIYRARIGERDFYFQSLPIPLDKRGRSTAWMDDKHLLKRFFSDHQIPSPISVSVQNAKEARAALATVGGTAVIKPRSGSRGRHTTVFVKDEQSLMRAFESAKKLCTYVSIETHLTGPVSRATVVDGTLAGFFTATAPSVTGDGVSNITELIEKKNSSKKERVENIVLTDEHRRFLARQGYDEVSVPPDGEVVQLTHRTGRLFGGETRELLGSEHPDLRIILEKAARVLGVGIVGFDLIIPDPEKSPSGQRWGIIEANTLPYIDLHYLPLYGMPSNVAAHVWDMWGARIHRSRVDDAAMSATMQT